MKPFRAFLPYLSRNSFYLTQPSPQMMSHRLFKQTQRLFSTDLEVTEVEQEKPNVNVITDKNSWSYEFDDKEIKGVGFEVNTGNYVIIYTCKVCETRQSRSFTKQAYHKGVVIVKCECCANHHLIADNLKWFENDSVNIEDLVKRNNESIIKVNADGEMKEYFISKIKERVPEKNDETKSE